MPDTITSLNLKLAELEQEAERLKRDTTGFIELAIEYYERAEKAEAERDSEMRARDRAEFDLGYCREDKTKAEADSRLLHEELTILLGLLKEICTYRSIPLPNASIIRTERVLEETTQ